MIVCINVKVSLSMSWTFAWIDMHRHVASTTYELIISSTTMCLVSRFSYSRPSRRSIWIDLQFRYLCNAFNNSHIQDPTPHTRIPWIVDSGNYEYHGIYDHYNLPISFLSVGIFYQLNSASDWHFYKCGCGLSRKCLYYLSYSSVSWSTCRKT